MICSSWISKIEERITIAVSLFAVALSECFARDNIELVLLAEDCSAWE